MADWITIPIAQRCPNAEICLDPFHVTPTVKSDHVV